MKFRVVFISSAICLLMNFNMAGASNIISGNNLSNKQQSSSSVVIDRGGKDFDWDDFNPNYGGDNVITGNNNHDHVQSNVRSTVYIDKNGNRQETYDASINQNGQKGNSNKYGRNVITGNNNNNVQTSIKTSVLGSAKDNKHVASNVNVKASAENLSWWQKVKNWLG